MRDVAFGANYVKINEDDKDVHKSYPGSLVSSDIRLVWLFAEFPWGASVGEINDDDDWTRMGWLMQHPPYRVIIILQVLVYLWGELQK